MVGLVGLEPTTPALSRRCSNQLSYRPKPVAWPPRTQDESRIAGDILPTTDKCERLNLRASDLDHLPRMQHLASQATTPDGVAIFQKGGDPAAPSDTATLLRLHPSHEPRRGKRPPYG